MDGSVGIAFPTAIVSLDTGFHKFAVNSHTGRVGSEAPCIDIVYATGMSSACLVVVHFVNTFSSSSEGKDYGGVDITVACYFKDGALVRRINNCPSFYFPNGGSTSVAYAKISIYSLEDIKNNVQFSIDIDGFAPDNLSVLIGSDGNYYGLDGSRLLKKSDGSYVNAVPEVDSSGNVTYVPDVSASPVIPDSILDVVGRNNIFGLPDNVHFTGFVDSGKTIIKGSDKKYYDTNGNVLFDNSGDILPSNIHFNGFSNPEHTVLIGSDGNYYGLDGSVVASASEVSNLPYGVMFVEWANSDHTVMKGSDGKYYNLDGSLYNSNSCNGIDLSDLGFVNIDVFRGKLTLSGKDLLNRDFSDIYDIVFTDEDMSRGYKDVWLKRYVGNISSMTFRQPTNQLLGNGQFSIRGKYLSGISLTKDALSSVVNLMTSDYLGVANSLVNLGLSVFDFDLIYNLDNFFVGMVEPCSAYAKVLSGHFEDVEVSVIRKIYNDLNSEIESYDFSRFLYPKIRITINTGFEPMTDEDWCCPSIDNLPKSPLAGEYVIKEKPSIEEPISDVCDGLDLSGLGFVNIDVFKGVLTIGGKTILNESFVDVYNVEFTDSDMAKGYKDIWLKRFVGNIDSMTFKQPNNQLLGNGEFSIRGKYLSGISLSKDIVDLAGHYVSGNAIGVANNLVALGLSVLDFDLIYSLDNFFVGMVEPCSSYARVLSGSFSPVQVDPILKVIDEISEVIDGYDFSKFLYPKIRITINAGFEPMTDEDWCCPFVDKTPYSPSSGGYFVKQPDDVIPGPISPGVIEENGGNGESSGSNEADISCICDWLEKINKTLGEISNSIGDKEHFVCNGESLACIIKNALTYGDKGLAEITHNSFNRNDRNVINAIDEIDDLTHTEVVVTPADNVYINKVNYLYQDE